MHVDGVPVPLPELAGIDHGSGRAAAVQGCMTRLSRSAASWLSRGEVDQPGGVSCGAGDLAWGGFVTGAGVRQVVDGERAPTDAGLAE
jgi:hypothetical protein